MTYQDLISRHNNFIFVSPHLDDAVLSCTNLIDKLILKGKNVKVITVFTKPGKKTITPQAKKFLHSCGYTDAGNLFKKRKLEDIMASKYLGFSYKHLDFIDAAWRTNRIGKPIYKTRISQFSGLISANDNKTIKLIKKALSKHLANTKKRVFIFGPSGVGKHADHIIIKKIVSGLPYPKLFWEDVPYNIRLQNVFFGFYNKFNPNLAFQLRPTSRSRKNAAIKIYESQLRVLFPKRNIPSLPERFYFS